MKVSERIAHEAGPDREFLPASLGLGGRYSLPRYAAALVAELLRQLEQTWLNIHQSEEEEGEQEALDFELPICNQIPLEVAGVQSRPFDWSYLVANPDDGPLANQPDLEYDGIHVWWYKHPRRDLSTDRALTAQEWIDWFDRAMAAMQAEEDKYFGEDNG